MQTAPMQEPTPASASGPEMEPAQEPRQAPGLPEPQEEAESFPLWLHSGG